MDWFMLNDKPYLYQNNANTIEKITHQYHMHEIYERAAVIYNELLENPPTDVKGICSCANDLTDNGIMAHVVDIARQLKHFGVQSRSGRARGARPRCQINIYLRYGICDIDIYIRNGKRSAVDEEELIDNYLANSTKVKKSKVKRKTQQDNITERKSFCSVR